MVNVSGAIAQYTGKKDPQLREEMILQFSPLVRYVVGRLAISLPAILDSEDIVSHGIIGLIDAVEKFDPTRGVKFETYAISRIRGAIIDQLRALDWIPRSARQRAREIEHTYIRLEQTLGRPPTDEEMASNMGLDIVKFQQAELEASAVVLSLDSVMNIDDDESSSALAGTIEDLGSPNPVVETERHELLLKLAEAIDKLPDRERLIVSLYYYDELTMKEISQALTVSESRVCQLHARAILKLRAHLREFRDYPADL